MPSQGVTESGDDLHVPVPDSLNTRISFLVVLRTDGGLSLHVCHYKFIMTNLISHFSTTDISSALTNSYNAVLDCLGPDSVQREPGH
jgi:hypothetical protein